MKKRSTIAGMLVGCALGTGAAAYADDARPIVMSLDEAKFGPSVKTGDTEAAVAVLRGDPATGPASFLIKLKKGSTAAHYHTPDYQLVIIQGTMTHWMKGVPGSGVKRLEPGTYWFEPGGLVHKDTCVTEECLFFIQWMGKPDSIDVQGEK